MKMFEDDLEYCEYVKDILDNTEFNKLKNIEHHGISRFDHSLRVSYYSYKLAKTLRLDYYDVARGGLLHDFFLSDEDRTTKDRFISTFNHPKKAVKKAKEEFNINSKQEDMIVSHMFPVNLTIPKYAESWTVNVVDKTVGSFEFLIKFRYKLSYLANIYLIILFNIIK